MKKKVLFIVSAIVLAISVSAFVYVKNESDTMNQFFNANVEALAENEGGDLIPDGDVKCFFNIEESAPTGFYLVVNRCIDCQQVYATHASNPDYCMK